MTRLNMIDPALAEAVEAAQADDAPFAIATIVRTQGSTAARPGAKALLRADGSIAEGWIGGGCVRGAIKAAALRTYKTGRPEHVFVMPQEALAAREVASGQVEDGVRFARNGCPSKGSIEVFVEPYLPQPVLLIIGASPVAESLAELAPSFDWSVQRQAPDAPIATAPVARRYVVIATQGQGDLAALKTAASAGLSYVAFVGSAKKAATLVQKLADTGLSPDGLAHLQAPAGIDIGAETPAEIALSILADLTRARRAARVEETADA